MTKGDRVRITDRITPGIGEAPRPGMKGTIERQLENGTVLVVLENGKRGLFASWEVEPDVEKKTDG